MRKDSATYYLLSALIPYTKANLAYSFAPSLFIQELCRRHHLQAKTVRTAYDRALKNGLISIDDTGLPRLTSRGERKLAPFKPKYLRGAQLMVIFDVPEVYKFKRQQLRYILREFKFKQIQKSVWLSEVDCKTYLQDAVSELGLNGFVEIFEARKITT